MLKLCCALFGRYLTQLLLVLTLAVALIATVSAQMPEVRLLALFPPGGQVGTSVDVKVTSGVDLQNLQTLRFSHPGITAVQKVAEPTLKWPLPKPLSDQYAVSIHEDVPPGVYEARVIGTHGLSNARAFVVGERSERVETESNQSFDTASELPIGSVVNGFVEAGVFDYFKFTAEQGQNLLVDCHADRIDSRMDATLVLYDGNGKELARDRDTHYRDPLIHFVVDADGTYVVKVCDFLYEGGPQYFYRLSVTEKPHIDAVFPPAVIPGTRETYTLYGRNLPGSTRVAGQLVEQVAVEIEVPDAIDVAKLATQPLVRPTGSMLDNMVYRLDTPQGPSNSVRLGYATGPVEIEQEPNDRVSEAHRLSLPCEVFGRFDSVIEIKKRREEMVAKTAAEAEAALAAQLAAEEQLSQAAAQLQQSQAAREVADQAASQADAAAKAAGEKVAMARKAANADPGSIELQRVLLSAQPAVMETAKAVATTTQAKVKASGDYDEADATHKAAEQAKERLDEALAEADARSQDAQKARKAVKDLDWFTFEAKQGDVYRVEIFSHRIGMPADPYLLIQQVTSGEEPVKDLYEIDDIPSEGQDDNFKSAGRDPMTRFEAPEDGTYRLLVCDLGPGAVHPLVYRLAIRPEQGDFRLVAFRAGVAFDHEKKEIGSDPRVIRLYRGGTDKIDVFAFRRGGFDGAIDVTIESLPDGVTSSRATIPPKSNHTFLILRADDEVADWTGPIQVLGKAQIGQGEVVRKARSAEVQVGSRKRRNASGRVPYSVNRSRLTEETMLSVDGDWSLPFKLESDQIDLAMSRGGTIPIVFKLTRRDGFKEKVELKIEGLPKEINPKDGITIEGDKSEGKLELNASRDIAPQGYPLLVTAKTQVKIHRDPDALPAAVETKKRIDEIAVKSAEEAEAALAAQREAEQAFNEAVAQLQQAQTALASATQAASEADVAAKAAGEKVAQATEEAAADAGNEELQRALETARQTVADTAQAVESVAKAKARAAAEYDETDTVRKAAEEAKQRADKTLAEANAKSQGAQEARKAAEELVKVSKEDEPRNVTASIPAVALLLDVKPAPITLELQMSKVSLRPGNQFEIPVTVSRMFGFKDSVNLTLSVPESIQGVKLDGDTVTVGEDQTRGRLVIVATKQATTGQHTLNVRAQVKYKNHELDMSVPLEIVIEEEAKTESQES